MGEADDTDLSSTAAIYMSQWRLVDDGPPLRTASSYLVPVTRDGSLAMLKVTSNPMNFGTIIL